MLIEGLQGAHRLSSDFAPYNMSTKIISCNTLRLCDALLDAGQCADLMHHRLLWADKTCLGRTYHEPESIIVCLLVITVITVHVIIAITIIFIVIIIIIIIIYFIFIFLLL